MTVDAAATETQVDDEPRFVLTVTPEAIDRIIEIRDSEEDPGSLALRVAIIGVAGTDYSYDLAFAPISEMEQEDDLTVQDGLSVVVAADSIDRMRGATLDLPSNAGQGGLIIRNPNRADPLAGLDLSVTSDVAEKVSILLEQVVNPQLASHGGFAALVGVDGSTAYLTMGGGCQGCAASAQTLQMGIREQILDAIPEIAEVVDVTDHAAGDNPFYTE
jgi:Fe/S biogenesis protein NfuA